MIVIRRFRHGDERALFHVFFSAIHEIAVHDYTQAQIQAWAPADIDRDLWAKGIKSLNPFVALQHGKIVGYADVQASGYIDHFFVAGAYPRQGIGTLLMQRIHKQAADLGISQLSSEVSKTAQPFFSKHGFKVVAQKTVVRQGIVIPNALMYKSLKP